MRRLWSVLRRVWRAYWASTKDPGLFEDDAFRNSAP